MILTPSHRREAAPHNRPAASAFAHLSLICTTGQQMGTRASSPELDEQGPFHARSEKKSRPPEHPTAAPQPLTVAHGVLAENPQEVAGVVI